ncbi:MAG TPA: YncE family protein [Candidatus Nanoarchaeia archaeon]|nr:YncE family protein [Candidatus Nanoarchaeia archaeon]
MIRSGSALLIAAVLFPQSVCHAQSAVGQTAKGFKNAPQTRVTYRVSRRIKLGGEGDFWDYLEVDKTQNRIYVTRGTRVMVVQANTGKLIGELPGTKKVHAASVASDIGRIFVSNGIENEVRVFDSTSLAQVGSVVVGKNPDAVLYHPATKRVFVSNGESNDMTVVDATTLKAIGTIPLGGKPEYSVFDSAGRVYVNIEDRNSLVAVDPMEMKVLHEWPLGNCEEPTGLAIDREKGRLFSACSNDLMAITDIAAGKLIGSVPIGGSCDGVAFDTQTRHVVASNGEGTVTVVAEDRPGHYSVVQTLKTQPGGRTITYDEGRYRFLIPAGTYAPPSETAPTPDNPPILPGSFSLFVIEPERR